MNCGLQRVIWVAFVFTCIGPNKQSDKSCLDHIQAVYLGVPSQGGEMHGISIIQTSLSQVRPIIGMLCVCVFVYRDIALFLVYLDRHSDGYFNLDHFCFLIA